MNRLNVEVMLKVGPQACLNVGQDYLDTNLRKIMGLYILPRLIRPSRDRQPWGWTLVTKIGSSPLLLPRPPATVIPRDSCVSFFHCDVFLLTGHTLGEILQNTSIIASNLNLSRMWRKKRSPFLNWHSDLLSVECCSSSQREQLYSDFVIDLIIDSTRSN